MADPEKSIGGKAESPLWLEPVNGSYEPFDSGLADVLEFLPVGYVVVILVDCKENESKIMLHKKWIHVLESEIKFVSLNMLVESVFISKETLPSLSPQVNA